MIPLEDIAYLKEGSALQQRAYRVLVRHRILSLLEGFTPVLAGTIPIGVALENSDLDVLCCWKNSKDFTECLEKYFGAYPGFRLRQVFKKGREAVIADFVADGVSLEIFGQQIPVVEQEAYIHRVAEEYLLKEKGEGFRNAVLKLKREGLKTEPAFGVLLEMESDPYDTLLEYGKKIRNIEQEK